MKRLALTTLVALALLSSGCAVRQQVLRFTDSTNSTQIIRKDSPGFFDPTISWVYEYTPETGQRTLLGFGSQDGYFWKATGIVVPLGAAFMLMNGLQNTEIKANIQP